MDERNEGIRPFKTCISAHAVGNARGAMEEATEYAMESETFGKPISKHQSISFMLADMATKIEAARLLTLSAASALDSGERATLKAAHAKRFSAGYLHGGYYGRSSNPWRLRLLWKSILLLEE